MFINMWYFCINEEGNPLHIKVQFQLVAANFKLDTIYKHVLQENEGSELKHSANRILFGYVQ